MAKQDYAENTEFGAGSSIVRGERRIACGENERTKLPEGDSFAVIHHRTFCCCGTLGHPRNFSNHDAGRLFLIALVPPETLFDPPAVFALIVEQDPAATAHVVFQFYL